MSIPKLLLDKLSYAAVPLNLMITVGENEVKRGSGTGFFVRYDSRSYLITNRHVVSGVKLNSDTFPADRPHYVNYPVLKHKKPHIQWDRLNSQLYFDTEFKKPCWLIHPTHGAKIDVVALEVESEHVDNALFINEFEFDTFKPLVGDDVYILGFPYENKGGGNFPIWKRGSIASEPDIDLDELPKMYIDTASREGMSGAPVIYRRRGVHNLVDNKVASNSIIGEIQNFVGIYSGRIKGIEDSDDLKTQLGIVWKASVIQEIIEGGQIDTYLQ